MCLLYTLINLGERTDPQHLNGIGELFLISIMASLVVMPNPPRV